MGAKPVAAGDITLGILAGGRGTRLGQREKAWLRRDGISQVEHWARYHAGEMASVLISANRALERYEAIGLAVVRDRYPDLGPVGGLDALARACATPWLLTVPVDLVHAPDDLLVALVNSAEPAGAYVVDDDGVQPLVALWPVDALRAILDSTLPARPWAIRDLQQQLQMRVVRFEGVHLGNLNTPQDLKDAGVQCDGD